MFELINKKSPWDDMWRSMAAMMQYPFNEEKTIEKAGLKSLIGRPHNIVDVTDKEGNTIAQRLEVVTTPFKKDEVKVYVKNNFLTVECQAMLEEDRADEQEQENYIYKGISSKNYEFSVKLGDRIDQDNIQAKNQDGILTVTLPFIKKEEKLEEGARQIEVQ